MSTSTIIMYIHVHVIVYKCYMVLIAEEVLPPLHSTQPHESKRNLLNIHCIYMYKSDCPACMCSQSPPCSNPPNKRRNVREKLNFDHYNKLFSCTLDTANI